MANIESDADVGNDAECAGGGTPYAYFLLDGGNSVDIGDMVHVGQCLEAFQHHRDAGAVIHCFAGHERSGQPHHFAVDRRQVPDVDQISQLFLGVISDVNVQIFHGHSLVSFRRSLYMGRLGPDHTWKFSFAVDYDFLGQQHPLVDAADSAEAQKTFIFDFGDNKPNFVHMGGQHYLRPAGLLRGRPGPLHHDQIAQFVPADLVSPRAVLLQIICYAVFVAGNSGAFRQVGQYFFDIHCDSLLCHLQLRQNQSLFIIAQYANLIVL